MKSRFHVLFNFRNINPTTKLNRINNIIKKSFCHVIITTLEEIGMREHHKKAIERLTESIRSNPKYRALIITGSVAKGVEREDSDVDVVLVATDKEYERRKKRNNILYYETQFCDYPGGYIDGKIVNLEYLRFVAEEGTEPARDAFRNAWIAYSDITELENLIRKIPVYQKSEKLEKIQKFYAQFEIAYWYAQEAKKRNDNYLLTRSISDLILFGGRLILTHNETVFPYHKLFMIALSEVKEKPANLIELIEDLLEKRNSQAVENFYDSIKNFGNWEFRGIPGVRFMLDTELAWFYKTPYVGDL